jgi:creatinine amidohydrolase
MSDDDQDLLLERMTWNEVQVALDDHRSLIIPIGAIEQHGPHLPLGINAIVAFELARRVARRHGFVIAPVMCYAAQSSTSSGGGRSFPSFTFVTGQTLIDFVRDVTSEFFRIGFHQVAYLNGHYEDSALVHEVLTEAIAPYDKTCKAIMVNWWEQIWPEDTEHVFTHARTPPRTSATLAEGAVWRAAPRGARHPPSS